MRVTLFCCWLDCDSSLAGASFVMRVCKDGSDLQGGDSDNHTITGQQRTTTRAASKHETVEKTKKEEEGGGAFSACPWIPQPITFHSVVTKAEKKPGSDCDCDPGRGSTAEAAGLNRTGWSSHINVDGGLNMRYRRRVPPRPEPISRLVSLAAGERQEATTSRAAARAPGGLCLGGNDTTWNPSPLAV